MRTMDMAPDNMSISPIWSLSPFALQLDYFHPGRINHPTHGAVHHKTVPDTILAQVLEGRYEVVCDGQEELLQAGEVFVVPARHPVTITHHDSRAGRFRARWIHMRFSWMGVFDYLQSFSLPLAVRGPAAARLGHCMGRALHLHAEPAAHQAPLALQIQTLAIRTLKILCEVSPLREPPPQDDPRWRRLRPVLQWIGDHPEAAHGVPALAARASLSPSRFYELFKSAMGLSPMQHVWKIRLEGAARLLLSTDETMAAIAEKNGFADAFHFSRKFKTAFGLSPREYRRRNPFKDSPPPAVRRKMAAGKTGEP